MEMTKQQLKELQRLSKKYNEITLDLEKQNHGLAVDRDVDRLKRNNKEFEDVVEQLVAGSGTGGKKPEKV